VNIPLWLETALVNICDLIFELIPRKIPSFKILGNCKIVSHRGQHDNKIVFENTLASFDKILEAKEIWGIEFDFRWTKDLCPVVIHDPDLNRLYGIHKLVSDTNLSELKQICPLVPTLEEVLQRYGKRLHLMIEIKEELYPEPAKQVMILENIFSNLDPCKDFHLISLKPQMLDKINFLENAAKILVAEFNVNELSKIAIEKKYAGIAGHYILIGNKLVRKHLNLKQKIGIGYPKSKNSLFRELNRSVEWIFSNDAVSLNRIFQTELKKVQSLHSFRSLN
tara:strand:- start:5486 stop:6325 length:840 start_codon:yes stop_codon:yes gene_type:complete